jgi:hypothetical protein
MFKLKDVRGETIKNAVVFFAMAMVLALAAPALANGGCVVGSEKVAFGDMAGLGGLSLVSPENLNFDMIDLGGQNAQTFGFAAPISVWPFGTRAGPSATAQNNFNLEKHQTAGTADRPLINIELIRSGGQVARSIGTGSACNTVNLLTTQE